MITHTHTRRYTTKQMPMPQGDTMILRHYINGFEKERILQHCNIATQYVSLFFKYLFETPNPHVMVCNDYPAVPHPQSVTYFVDGPLCVSTRQCTRFYTAIHVLHGKSHAATQQNTP